MNESLDDARRLFLDGVSCFEAGRLADAEHRFQASLALFPQRLSTLTNLAATRIRLGRPADALVTLDQALAVGPDDAEAWSHRGFALADLGRHQDALACHDRALAADQHRARDWHQKGVLFQHLQRHEDALQMFQRTLELAPDQAEAWLRQGFAQQALLREEQALASCERALAIDPTLAAAWAARGSILKDLGRFEDAALSFEQAIANGGDAEVSGYFLASLRGASVPRTAPRSYVTSLFDSYAETFDAHLVGVLHYEVHRRLPDRLASLRGGGSGTALDLGCGTGLCGPALQAQFEHIDGIDLSERMLDKARLLGIYRWLDRAELAEYLAATDRRYDLVLAADVFPYVGDLQPVFTGARRVLNEGGWFCFTVESTTEDTNYSLQTSQRYAHSERYLRALATQHGFEIVELATHAIRDDRTNPIEGLFVHLRLVARPVRT
jgi:predicted TPR repeat methyltransferase